MARYDLYDIEAAVERALDEVYSDGYEDGVADTANKAYVNIKDPLDMLVKLVEDEHNEFHGDDARYTVRLCGHPLCYNWTRIMEEMNAER